MTQKGLRLKHGTILNWLSMIPNLNTVEHPLKELKHIVYSGEGTYKPETDGAIWVKLSVGKRRSISERYKNCLFAVIASKEKNIRLWV